MAAALIPQAQVPIARTDADWAFDIHFEAEDWSGSTVSVVFARQGHPPEAFELRSGEDFADPAEDLAVALRAPASVWAGRAPGQWTVSVRRLGPAEGDTPGQIDDAAVFRMKLEQGLSPLLTTPGPAPVLSGGGEMDGGVIINRQGETNVVRAGAMSFIRVDIAVDRAEAARESMEALEATASASEAVRVQSEADRSEAETLRAEGELARAQLEAQRVEDETARAEAETARLTAEDQRIEDEASRALAEGGRAEAEQGRGEAEALRVSAEADRAEGETGRVAGEGARSTAEDARAAAEALRLSGEQDRIDREAERAGAEVARVETEADRATSEGQRVAAEDLRAAAEGERVEAETERAGGEAARVQAEDLRAAAEGDRASAETTRGQSEDARTASETQRGEAEGLRIEGEQSRAEAEGERNTAESGRSNAEDLRAQGEFERGQNEVGRVLNEAGRGEAEAVRVQSEDDRLANETGRVEAEGVRAAGEDVRVGAETARGAAEGQRVTAEGQRQAAEEQRGEDEVARVAGEQGRVSAEIQRASDEQNRLDAETARVEADGARATADALWTQREEDRHAAEGDRLDAEEHRDAAEVARLLAEDGRLTQEALRVDAEDGRVTAEGQRVTFEAAREEAESERVSSEQARVDADAVRIAADEARATADALWSDREVARHAAETDRLGAEEDRDANEVARILAEDERLHAEGVRAADEVGRVEAEVERVNAEAARAAALGAPDGYASLDGEGLLPAVQTRPLTSPAIVDGLGYRPQNRDAVRGMTPFAFAQVKAIDPVYGVFRGLNCAFFPLEGGRSLFLWREAPGHGNEIPNTKILCAPSEDYGDSFERLASGQEMPVLVYRHPDVDTRNFAWGVMAGGRKAIMAARVKPDGSHLDPVFAYSDDPDGKIWTPIVVPKIKATTNFHSRILPHPDGPEAFIVYYYESNGATIGAFKTLNNGLSWTELQDIVPKAAPYTALTELSVAQQGNENFYLMTIRASGSTTVAISTSTNMETWTPTAPGGVVLGANPPELMWHEDRFWFLSYSRSAKQIVPGYTNALVRCSMRPDQIAEGFSDWEVVTGLPFFPTGYISWAIIEDRFYGLFTCEDYAGSTQSRTGYLMLLSSDVSPSLPLTTARRFVRPTNVIRDPGFRRALRGDVVAVTSRRQVFDGITAARTSSVGGLTIRRVTGDQARYALRVQRDEGNTATQPIIICLVLSEAESARFRGQQATLSLNARVGADFSSVDRRLTVQQRSSASPEQVVTAASGSFSAGDTTVGTSSSGFNLTTDWRSYQMTPGRLNADICQLMLRLTWTPTGIAAAEDFFDIECAVLVPGAVAVRYEPPPADLEELRCDRYFQVFNVRVRDGKSWVPFSERMHRKPNVTVSSGTVDTNEVTRDGFMLRHVVEVVDEEVEPYPTVEVMVTADAHL